MSRRDITICLAMSIGLIVVAFWMGRDGCPKCGGATQFLQQRLTERGLPTTLLNTE